MDTGLVSRVEAGIERGASALFAAAVSYSAYSFAGRAGLDPQFVVASAGAGALAFLPCSRVLGLVGGRRACFAVADFPVQHVEFTDPPEELLLTDRVELLLTDRLSPEELLLTDADRVDCDAPLVLDDILEEIGPDARVVSLFDRKAMPAPTPGQLQSRIADHLKDGTSRSAPPNLAGPSDASKALSEALAELRRSLR